MSVGRLIPLGSSRPSPALPSEPDAVRLGSCWVPCAVLSTDCALCEPRLGCRWARVQRVKVFVSFLLAFLVARTLIQDDVS